MFISAFYTSKMLCEEVDHRAASKMLEIGNIGAQRPADRTKTRNIWPAWLIDQNPIDGVGIQIMFNLFEQPGAECFVVIAGEVMEATVAIFDPGLRMTKNIPARDVRRASEQIAVAAKTQIDLQPAILCLL